MRIPQTWSVKCTMSRRADRTASFWLHIPAAAGGMCCLDLHRGAPVNNLAVAGTRHDHRSCISVDNQCTATEQKQNRLGVVLMWP
jgi:hypothetical protein